MKTRDRVMLGVFDKDPTFTTPWRIYLDQCKSLYSAWNCCYTDPDLITWLGCKVAPAPVLAQFAKMMGESLDKVDPNVGVARDTFELGSIDLDEPQQRSVVWALAVLFSHSRAEAVAKLPTEYLPALRNSWAMLATWFRENAHPFE